MIARYDDDVVPKARHLSPELRLGTFRGAWERNPRALIEPDAVVLSVVDG